MRIAPAAPTLALIPLAGCAGPQAMLDPAGHTAMRVAELWWFMFAVGSAVWIIVMAFAVYVLFVRRNAPSEEPIARRTAGDERRVRWVAGGAGTTLVILIVVFVYSLVVGRSVQALAVDEPMTIEVIGHQWWWQVIYHHPEPSQRFETANELYLPVGEPVRILLRTMDVIHSFWVPNLAGKLDLVPGRTNTLWIRADEPGDYRGQCAQFCGMQHAKMAFTVAVGSPEEFVAWAERQRQPARPPVAEIERLGEQVFMSHGCAICHTVRGTGALATVGPDLTHVAGRATLAAGALPNTTGHLAGWIADPQGLKPGNRMPRVPLTAEELQALLAYLNTLN